MQAKYCRTSENLALWICLCNFHGRFSLDFLALTSSLRLIVRWGAKTEVIWQKDPKIPFSLAFKAQRRDAREAP
jgi:hypothetical protein